MGNEWVKGCATKTNGKRHSLIPGAHPPHAQFSVILRKSGRTCFTENFGYTIYIYIYSKISMRVQQCVRFACYAHSLSINIYQSLNVTGLRKNGLIAGSAKIDFFSRNGIY